MLLEGVRLMGVGMTTVFAFLTLLVLAMQFNRAVGALFPDPVAEPKPRLDSPSANDDAEIAVVLAAIAAARGGR